MMDAKKFEEIAARHLAGDNDPADMTELINLARTLIEENAALREELITIKKNQLFDPLADGDKLRARIAELEDGK
jgi:hypothetical protein